MGKINIYLLAAAMILSLSGCQNNNDDLQTQINELRERVAVLEYQLSIQTSSPVQQENTNLPQAPSPSEAENLAHEVAEKYLTPNGDWNFQFHLINTTDIPLHFWSLNFIDNGEDWLQTVRDNPDFFMNVSQGIGLDFMNLTLNPGDSIQWGDGHPGEDWLKSRTYVFTFLDDQGKAYEYRYEYQLINSPASGSGELNVDYSGDPGQDLLTLRHEADFQMEVAPEIFWVPARHLGESRYSNAQIHQLLGASPEEKQQQISSLYEALQLYQIGNFAAADDNIRQAENGINWEHHKPGYDAVRTNEGCCATSANWLNYILDGDYEEVGYIATSQRDGSGHIFNYIFQDGWYYIIDLTHYRTDWISTAEENGDLNMYHSTDFIPGNIHKTRDIQRYVDYVQNTYNDPPGLMFLYDAQNCLAIDSVRKNNQVTIVYEDVQGIDLQVIFDDSADALDHSLVPSPVNRPVWN